MPGADHPLFTVPDGKMGVGLGIHGEPGVSEDDLPTAADLAGLLVDGAARRARRDRGLACRRDPQRPGRHQVRGAVRRVGHRLPAASPSAGLVVVDPEVGELVTSLDMAGCSLTLVGLDDELERFWRAPADSPAYKKGSLAEQSAECAAARSSRTSRTRTHADVAASAASRGLRRPLAAALDAMHGGCSSTPRTSSVASTPSPATATTAAAWSRASSAAVDAADEAMAEAGGASTAARRGRPRLGDQGGRHVRRPVGCRPARRGHPARRRVGRDHRRPTCAPRCATAWTRS